MKKKKKKKPEREDPLFRNKEYMNENSILLFYYIYLLYISFGISVIHQIKKESVTFNFLGTGFSPARVVTAMEINL